MVCGAPCSYGVGRSTARKRFYVSVSRAKQRLFLVGEEEAFGMNNLLSQVPEGLYSKLSPAEVRADYVRY